MSGPIRREPAGAKRYIVYDERALSGDTDDAAVLVALGSKREARDYPEWDSCPVYEYTINERGEGVNETFVGTVRDLRRQR